jgi:hypothetical protein
MLIQNEIQCGPDRDYGVRYSGLFIPERKEWL